MMPSRLGLRPILRLPVPALESKPEIELPPSLQSRIIASPASGYRIDGTIMDITLTDLEQAINYWRGLCPSTGEERALSPQVNALANVYALMIFHRRKSLPLEAVDQDAAKLLEDWRKQQA
jgi:hypothetical protein